jgi:3-phenylpropionate/trans-cinnamate dioxygenase ferredoxin component
MSEWVDVAREDEISPGAHRAVEIDGVVVAVFNVDGDFLAIEDVCTHDYQALTDGPVDGEVIMCPRHGARFNLRTGAALCAPAYEPVPTFPVRLADGMIQVKDDRWD